ncbi:SH3 domain-containing protein [Pseudoroseomonas cervicalis]|uniref:SH3 domain-containing protein n=1 Tax=Teichococcus cervicalis TaxID=204525 RepID=UPI0022F1B8AD|nr:SH3 domain-containing protein [Pseudoroseomonas cervicalis]WBV42531.1 SH3 domain-containing protein [Pseudoroseomonas cervicalis]
MSAAASIAPSGHQEIEFRLVDGHLRAFNRVAVHSSTRNGASGSSGGLELDLPQLASVLESAIGVVRQLEAELPKHLAARDAAFRRTARAASFPLKALIGWRLPALRSRLAAAERQLEDAVARRNGHQASFHFDFAPATLTAFRNLAMAFSALGAAKAIWITAATTAGGTASAPVRGAVLHRQVVKLAPTLPEHVASEWPGLAFRHHNGRFELYPGFAMLDAGSDTRTVSLLDVRLDMTSTVIAENIEPPVDAILVARLWDKANKDGSPDRRYANNRSTPIVQYCLLRFSAPGLAAISYLVSHPDLAQRFAAAFSELQHCLADEAQSRADGLVPRGVIRTVPSQRKAASVPPPPSVSQAHEYTVAALVGGIIGIWLLTMGLLGRDQQAIASGSGAQSIPVTTLTQSAAAPNGYAETIPSPPLLATALPPSSTTATAPSTKTVTAPERERIIVRAGGANIRSAPNGAADVLRTTSGGTRLNVFGRSGGWVRVGDVDAWGWVHSSLLEGGN